MEPIALKVLIGFIVGSLVGMTGLGGGVLMLPLLIFVLNVPAIIAVGSDAAVNAITKLGAGFLHWRSGNVNWTVVLGLAAGSVPGACLGAGLLAYIRSLYGAGVNDFIKVAIGSLLILVPLLFVLQGELQLGIHRRASAYLLCSLPDLSWLNECRQAPTSERKSLAGMALIGLIAGFLVGATSVGSGSVIMVLLMLFYRLAPSKMIGTDIVHGLLLTGVTSLLHLGMGNVDGHLVAPLLIGSIPGALLGTRVANAMPASWLRRLLCAILFATGLRMVWI